MSDLFSHRKSILDLSPSDLLSFILDLRLARRNNIVAAATHKARTSSSVPKKTSQLVASLSLTDLQELLEQLQQKKIS